MHTETIAGLHKCQPKNAPEAGTIKNMVVLNMPAKNGKKAWIKITNKKPEEGGSPYRILNVEALDWPPDQYQNVAFNIEVEATSSAPTSDDTTRVYERSSFKTARATMQKPDKYDNEDQAARDLASYDLEHAPESPKNAPQSQPHAQQGEDGVTEARKHLMRCCNLYNLCIAAADKAIAPNMPEIARTQEQFQSTLASLWIEASSRRCTNGVDWWSYIDKMPDTPVNGGKHTATVKPIQKEEETDVPF